MNETEKKQGESKRSESLRTPYKCIHTFFYTIYATHGHSFTHSISNPINKRLDSVVTCFHVLSHLN